MSGHVFLIFFCLFLIKDWVVNLKYRSTVSKEKEENFYPLFHASNDASSSDWVKAKAKRTASRCPTWVADVQALETSSDSPAAARSWVRSRLAEIRTSAHVRCRHRLRQFIVLLHNARFHPFWKIISLFLSHLQAILWMGHMIVPFTFSIPCT